MENNIESAGPLDRDVRGWLPIETAPTTGDAILVSNGSGVWVAKHKAVYQSGFKPDTPWFCLMLNKDHIPARMRKGCPTHWMPLPEAPNGEVSRGAEASDRSAARDTSARP